MDLYRDFKHCSLEGDRTSLFYTAKALMQMQSAYGFIPNVYGKGHNAQLVTEMLERMRREKASRVEEQRISPEIDTLILLDREVDLITPLCTQLTYEGLVDEVFGIFNATVELPPEMVIDPKADSSKDPIPPGKKFNILFNSSDKLFAELRDENFSIVGPRLNSKAKDIDAFYKQRKTAKNMAEINAFMKQLPLYQKEHSNLRVHTNITESILNLTRDQVFRARLDAEQTDPTTSMAYIEECINKQEPLVKVLRLVCLYSLTNNGIREKTFNYLKRDIVHTYGYKYLYTLDNLTKLGMFKISKGASNYQKLKTDLKLVIEEMNETEPSDIAYVYSGYAPISIRLVEKLMEIPKNQQSTNDVPLEESQNKSSMHLLESKPWKTGWGSAQIDNLIKDSPGGPHFHMKQALPKGITLNEAPEGKKVVLVFFIGGCTYTEVSAIRFLSKKNPEYSFIVGTTKLINGNTLIESLIENFEKADNVVVN